MARGPEGRLQVCVLKRTSGRDGEFGPFFQHYFKRGKMLRLVERADPFPCSLCSLLYYLAIGFNKSDRQLLAKKSPAG